MHSYWLIANRLHSVLDMTVRGDFRRVRRCHAAQNLAVLRRIAVNICRRDQSDKTNPSKIRRASWNDDLSAHPLLSVGR